MEESLKNYWKLYNEFYTNEMMIHKKNNPLREYEDEFVDGPVLEIGCGQSSFLVELSKSGKEIFAVDNDSSQLDFLDKRISAYGATNPDKIHLLNLTIPTDKLPEKKFSVVIMSDIIHFFTLKDSQKLVDELIPRTTKGSLIYVRVHSKKHSYNDPSDPEIHDYFKHFFSPKDLENLFDEKYFECLVCSESQQFIKSKHELNLEAAWLSGLLDMQGITDQNERAEAIYENSRNIVDAWISCIYRRK
jgi:SAM-dependent methyltransferase